MAHRGAAPRGSVYWIYYGWLTEDEAGEPNAKALRLAAAGIPLLIAHAWTAEPERHLNLSGPVLDRLRAGGTVVFGYVATGYGAAARADVQSALETCLAAGVDGVFFDEVDGLRNTDKLAFYTDLTRQVRAAGRRVILNTGVAQCGERIMDLADILMVEHQWRDLRLSSPWVLRYDAERFMGVSSNEEEAMGYTIDETRAIADTREAWGRGIGWHTSTEQYVALPHWFERYIQATN